MPELTVQRCVGRRSEGILVSGKAGVVPRRFQFGSFDVNAASRELLRNRERIPLQELPFRVLLLLLERSGEIVTREEFHGELWPDGTFVEFEQGLNTAIKKVRQALSDDAESPRFIETVPRRGYRFLVSPLASTQAPVRSGGERARIRIVCGVCLALLAGAAVWMMLPGGPIARAESLVSNLERLTADAGLTWQPALSPDGKLMAFSSDRAGANLDIWVMHVGGGEPIPLTD